MPLLPASANALWLLTASGAALRWRANLHRVAEVQEEILLRTLRRNARTPFGIAHGFSSVRSVREYQSSVPVRRYDELVGITTEAQRAQRRAFESGIAEPVERYERTSGSSGASKRIPVTRSLRREFAAAIAPWITALFVDEPRAFAGPAYWSVSPGGESDEAILGALQRRLVRAVQAVPSSVRLNSDVDAFRRETLQHLTRCRTLSLISVWHPSFLELLVGDLDTEAAWPHLRVISCWADANAAYAAASLARRFPHATIQPKGLLSTEGFVSIPVGSDQALAYRSHFFEFADGAGVRTASELEPGRRYRVILTTGGGLYRYDTEDVVEVTGFREHCPLLRFVGRADHVSDHFGEKLNEVFVRESLERVLSGTPREFAMLACEQDAYVLYVQSCASDDAINDASAALDRILREAHHYDLCRTLGQLQPLRTFRVARGAAETYLRVRATTQTLGNIKIPALDREQGWSAHFEGTFVG